MFCGTYILHAIALHLHSIYCNVETGSDSFTAKQLATGASVNDPLDETIKTDSLIPNHSSHATSQWPYGGLQVRKRPIRSLFNSHI